MMDHYQDGPTSIFYRYGSACEMHKVLIAQDKPSPKLAQLEEILYNHCGIHFLNSMDVRSFDKVCAVPLTLIAEVAAHGLYFAIIDPSQDIRNFEIGLVKDSFCIPVVRGIAELLRLMVCYPSWVESTIKGNSFTQEKADHSENKPIFESQRDDLLRIMGLSRMELCEYQNLMQKAATRKPLALIDCSDN